jgi:hypothetical protein
LNRAVGQTAKDQGYEYIIGHSRKGMAVNVAVRLGAKVIKEWPDWFGTGISYYQVEVDLKK